MLKNKNYSQLAYGWFLIAVGAWFYGYEFILRILPRVWQSELVSDYSLNPATFGFLASLYYYSYTIMQLPAGVIFDRYGTKNIFVLAMMTCLAGTGLINMCSTYYCLCLSRLLIGFGSSFAFVGVLKIASNHLPARYFSFISGLTTTIGMMFASMGSIFLASLLTTNSWLDVNGYLFFSGIPLLGMFLFLFPKDNQKKISSISWRNLFLDVVCLFQQPKIVAAGLLGGLLLSPTQVLLEAYGESFLQTKSPFLSRVEISQVLSFVYLGWMIGGPLWGWIAHDKKIRIKALNLSLFSSTFVLLVIFMATFNHDSTLLMKMLFMALGFCSSPQVLIFSIAKEASDAKYAATAIALANCFVSLFGAFFPHAIGLIQQELIVTYSAEKALSMSLFALPLSLVCGFWITSVLKKSNSPQLKPRMAPKLTLKKKKI